MAAITDYLKIHKSFEDKKPLLPFAELADYGIERNRII